jgi:DNA (cytosine-5)-methyltransferase 1
MSANLTMTDLFCGAGGSSTGATQVPGVTVRLAANHWALAVATHNANHPDTDHLQADISVTDPRYVPRTDLLWASPECTNHSRAKGRKQPTNQPDLFGDTLPDEAAERSRATMWDVVRFTEAHHYRAVLVENVVEVTGWPPFRAWLAAMSCFGYAHKVISLNSMHAQAFGLPAAQSRDRAYVAFWRTGERPPDFERMQRPRAWCPTCATVVEAVQSWKRPGTVAGRYRAQYVYRCPKHSCRGQVVEPGWLPASTIIDWSLPGQRIGDRAKPLADKTLHRIRMGIDRYWAPFLQETANGYDAADPKHARHGDPDSYYRVWPLTDPTQVMHTRESKALVIPPVAVPVEGRAGKQPVSMLYPMRTMTTRNETGVALPTFLTELRGGGSWARPASEALSTVSAGGNHHGLVVPAGGTWNDDARPTDETFRAMTTREAYGLVVPYYGHGQATPAGRPLPTVTTTDRHALIMRHNNNPGPDQSSMTTPDYEPVRTMTTSGHQSVMTGHTVNIDDVRFRMLEPSEIKQAMAFPADYLMRGNRREQVKLSGNAVTPPAARDLIATVAAAITGEVAA